jgi:regulator of PEP synthase PpsR (kinase-PPPase family)
MQRVFIISDGTGRTAAQILKAALTQFEDTEVDIKVFPEMRTEDQILDVIRRAKEVDGFIVHTVVSRRLRDLITRAGRRDSVETIDLMGPLLAQLSDRFADSPLETPGLFYRLNRAYFQRIEAMEFAFRHDDGQRADELMKAEIVLVGVSRTFKTPISMYLAFRGWLAANVPVVMGSRLPAILDELPPRNVVGLMTNPNHLARIRQTRHKYLGGVTKNYIDPDMVRLEILHARRLFNEHPNWPVVTITNKPIEEIASEILELLKKDDRGS